MPLCIGANDGVYRTPSLDSDPERVLDAGTTLQVRRLDGTTYATTDDGLFRSADGREWTDCGLPADAATSVAVSPDGSHLYAGTRPAHLSVSEAGGDTWERSDAFAALPGREDWVNLGGVGPQVRSLAVHRGAPARVVVGVEAAGVFVSPDRGDTWQRRSNGLNADVHDLTVLASDDWIAACGRGCYRTTDAGRSWTALDTSPEQFWHTYHREAVVHDGVLYVGAQDRAAARYDDDAGGLLLASRTAGRDWTTEPYPGDADSFPLAWAEQGSRLLAATNDGRVLARDTDGWRTAASVQAAVRSLAAW
jgi:photosystem II stability/assembly factor-like uncharacterized protein